MSSNRRGPAPGMSPSVRAELETALGNLHGGRPRAAQSICENVVASHPECAPAWQMLGVIAQSSGRMDEALSCLEKAVALDDRDPGAHNSLAIVYQALGRHAEALRAYDRALAIKPDLVEALGNRGNTLAAMGKTAEAMESYRRALALKPSYGEVYLNLGLLHVQRGARDEAIRCYRQAIAVNPTHVAAYQKLGVELSRDRRLEETVACFEEGIRHNPRSASLHYFLGTARMHRGELEGAIQGYRQAIALQPNFHPALTNLGHALCSQGRIEEGMTSFRRAVMIAPADHHSHSNLLFALSSSQDLDAQAIFEEHKRWYLQHGAGLSGEISPYPNERSPARRLRVGYVSADFRTHSVAFFIEPLLEAHDRESFEIFCYSDVGKPDAVTERLRASANEWRDISGVSDAEVAGRIREDGIDILIDLAGHTAQNRMLVFARKPAPVQVSYLGYPNTTGQPTIDYRLTDERADPPEADAFYCEKLVRLSPPFLCYRPPGESPDVRVPPASQKGFVTFGSFNNPRKLSAGAVQTWSRLLDAVPGSRLVLKYRGLNEAGTQRHIHSAFEARGIAPERVHLWGYSDALEEHLAQYAEVDVALDTFPYNGTTTTCEALWMGVPVVTLAGKTHAGRVGLSLLAAVGLEEWAAGTPDEYVTIAAGLASDSGQLAAHRARLREQLAASPLLDAPRLSASIEAAYREMWGRWCRG